MIRLNLMDERAWWRLNCINIYHKMLALPPDCDFLRADRFDLDHYFMPGSVASIEVHGQVSDELAERLAGLMEPTGTWRHHP